MGGIPKLGRASLHKSETETGDEGTVATPEIFVVGVSAVSSSIKASMSSSASAGGSGALGAAPSADFAASRSAVFTASRARRLTSDF